MGRVSFLKKNKKTTGFNLWSSLSELTFSEQSAGSVQICKPFANVHLCGNFQGRVVQSPIKLTQG